MVRVLCKECVVKCSPAVVSAPQIDVQVRDIGAPLQHLRQGAQVRSGESYFNHLRTGQNTLQTLNYAL